MVIGDAYMLHTVALRIAVVSYAHSRATATASIYVRLDGQSLLSGRVTTAASPIRYSICKPNDALFRWQFNRDLNNHE